MFNRFLRKLCCSSFSFIVLQICSIICLVRTLSMLFSRIILRMFSGDVFLHLLNIEIFMLFSQSVKTFLLFRIIRKRVVMLLFKSFLPYFSSSFLISQGLKFSRFLRDINNFSIVSTCVETVLFLTFGSLFIHLLPYSCVCSISPCFAERPDLLITFYGILSFTLFLLSLE